MERLWLTPARATYLTVMLVPIWWTYFWRWLAMKWFGRTPSPEAWSRIHRRSARRFYRTAVRMKGGLIKVGQVMSTRVDLLPAEWAEVLSLLQDKVEPSPWRRVARTLEGELGARAETLFASIEKDAVNAASFGQVHRAVTKEGRRVAIKIQYPGIRTRLACDLWVGRKAAPFFAIFAPVKVNLGLILDEIQRALTEELDYRKEARFGHRIRENLLGIEDLVVPEVIFEHSSRSVLCTEWFDGFKVTDVAKREAVGMEVEPLILKMMEAYTHMFFIDGVFQSDPHPGNLMARMGEHGRPVVCILDFGQSKELPKGFQRKLIHAAIAFMGRDVDGFSRAVVAMDIARKEDVEAGRPLLQTFFDDVFELSPQELKEMDAEDLKRMAQELAGTIEGVHIPTDLILYGRAFMLLAGVVTQLDETINGFVLAKPIIMKALMRPENFAPLEEAAA
ncbi:MAG: AarF/UbiB family protein [Myxococcota bacterium]